MKYRKDRLEELIKRIVSEIIFRELKDPRIGFVTITGVELNKDYTEAKIGVSILGSSTDVRKSMEGIRSSSGFVQKQLGKELKIRNLPRVYFYLDKSIEEGVDMVNKINNLPGVIDSKDDEDLKKEDEDSDGDGEILSYSSVKISGFNNAVILLDKPEGKTSFDLISAVKRITGIKKIGHSGTLDKFATGLMVVCTGNATRLTRFFLEDDKRYTGRIKLGIETDTCDITGEIISEKAFSSLEWSTVAETLSRFTGNINQIPPKYSALKIDGKRASDRMRSGEDIDLAGRDVKIYSIDVIDVDPVLGHVDFDVFCSKGTYIRSLARDFGERLGTGACLSSLRRISSGVFNISQAATIDELKEAAERSDFEEKPFLLSPMEVLKGFSKIILNETGAARVANGALFSRADVIMFEKKDGDFFIIADNQENLIAIAEIDIEKWLIIYDCVFN